MRTIPKCQLNPSQLDDQPRKKCQAALLDNTEEKILIVYEKSYPKHLRRWGLPKGKFKTGETATECVHREVCEEVGINVDQYPHVYRKKGRDQIIVFNKPADEIKLYIGPEILHAKWVDLNWLKSDVAQDKLMGKMDPNYKYKYNNFMRSFIPKI